jgi:YHS domain-containing protein
MGKRITRRKKGPVQAKKIKYDGINFASGLERHMYMALQKAKIKAEYEGKTYTLLNGFDFTSECYERQSNGKGDFTNRGNKRILPIRYTPDFVADDFIIECKGRANESFPMRWKLFKKHVQENMPNVTLYKPQNQNECDQVIQHILAKRNK